MSDKDGTTFIIEDYGDESSYMQSMKDDEGKYEVYEQFEFYVPYYEIPNQDGSGAQHNSSADKSDSELLNNIFAGKMNDQFVVDDNGVLQQSATFRLFVQVVVLIYDRAELRLPIFAIDLDRDYGTTCFAEGYVDEHSDWKGPIITEIKDEQPVTKVPEKPATHVSAEPAINRVQNILETSTVKKTVTPAKQTVVKDPIKNFISTFKPPQISEPVKIQPANPEPKPIRHRLLKKYRTNATVNILPPAEPTGLANKRQRAESGLDREISSNMVNAYGMDVIQMINNHNRKLEEMERGSESRNYNSSLRNVQSRDPNYCPSPAQSDKIIAQHVNGAIANPFGQQPNRIVSSEFAQQNPFNKMRSMGKMDSAIDQIIRKQSILKKLNDVYEYVAESQPIPAYTGVYGGSPQTVNTLPGFGNSASDTTFFTSESYSGNRYKLPNAQPKRFVNSVKEEFRKLQRSLGKRR